MAVFPIGFLLFRVALAFMPAPRALFLASHYVSSALDLHTTQVYASQQRQPLWHLVIVGLQFKLSAITRHKEVFQCSPFASSN